jgi:hypothetical protein
MNSFGRLSKSLAFSVATALALLTVSSAGAATAGAGSSAGKATVKQITGSATYKGASGSGSLTIGMTLKAGDTITTGANSSVVLDLGESGGLQLKANSTLSLDTLEINPGGSSFTTVVSLTKGDLVGNTKKISAASRYEVKTPNGVAGIRGTAFSISYVGIFRCANGQLVVTVFTPGQPPRAYSVNSGQSCNVSGGTGAAPQVTITPIPPADIGSILGDAKFVAGMVVDTAVLPTILPPIVENKDPATTNPNQVSTDSTLNSELANLLIHLSHE